MSKFKLSAVETRPAHDLPDLLVPPNVYQDVQLIRVGEEASFEMWDVFPVRSGNVYVATGIWVCGVGCPNEKLFRWDQGRVA